jgi:hypothetical protein
MAEEAATAEPKAPSLKRAELSEALKAEVRERVQRCRAKIEAVLKEENCILTATPVLEEASPGVFVTKASPGIRAL